MNLLQASEIMRRGEKIPRRQQAGLVIALSVPAILEQLVSTLMSYIDTAMVGSLGYFATASIGVVASTTWLLNGLVSAAAVGFSVQVAQYLGAGRERDSRDVLCQAILFNAAFGAALAVLAVLAGQFLPAALGAEAALRPYARAYFCTVAAFLPFSMACAFYSSILRCSGSVVLPSVLNVGMCLLDMLFNFFLIYPTRQIGGVTVWGAGLGVTGAALGTGLAQACIGLMLLFLVLRRRGPLRLQGGERWRFTRPCMRSALQLATPAALERLALCLAQIVMTAVVTGMGPVAVAANYVAVQTESICYLPAYGIATAATALVGQSIGAGRQDMAKRFAYGTTALGFGLVTVMGGLLFWLAPVPIGAADAGGGGHRPQCPGAADRRVFRAAVCRQHRRHRRAAGGRGRQGAVSHQRLQHVGAAGAAGAAADPGLRRDRRLGDDDGGARRPGAALLLAAVPGEVAEHVKNKFLTCSQTRLLCISSRGKISTLCKLE